MQNVSILGSTGSIGESTLDVIRRHPNDYRLFALTANSQISKLAKQCEEFNPKFAVVSTEKLAGELSSILNKSKTKVLWGKQSLSDVVIDNEVDIVMAAIVGAAGLVPTLDAAKAGKKILLANKEALVMSGKLFMNAVLESGASLLPIDSEHNAIFQCLPPLSQNEINQGKYLNKGVSRLVLTASGGPFLNTAINALANVSPDQACAHPNWSMGRKISVDSATMMNKGLELIEAQWLFGLSPDNIEVLIHPQSVIHSMVTYIDGSILAQMGQPDMRTPIAYGLGYPKRINSGVHSLNLQELSGLTFFEPDLQRFPCLRLAREASIVGGAAPVVMNAANEIAVEAFLNGGLRYLQIANLVEEMLNQNSVIQANTLEEILELDRSTREKALAYVGFLGRH
jgi:1-deoxy-D-xylulose-5-phosphate reductoisomerase